MISFKKLIWLAITLVSSIHARSSTGDSVLVIVEPKKQNSYNIFFDGLRGKSLSLSLTVCFEATD